MSVPTAVVDRIEGSTEMAHIATAVDDRPHVAPVWYAYDDGELHVLTGGRKLENARSNPRVAVSIEESHGGRASWTVTLLGTARIVDDPDRRRDAAARIFPTYLGDDTDTWDEYYRRAVEDVPDGSLLVVDIGSATLQTY